MRNASHPGVSTDIVVSAFEVMGRYLREREVLGEIAVYGGTAILLQFEWRKVTEDVDAVIRTSEREGVVKDAAAYAALRLGLPDDWLNNFVGFTSETETEAFFSVYGLSAWEDAWTAGLPGKARISLRHEAKALQRDNVGDRDFEDAVKLATVIGISTADELARLVSSFFSDQTLDPMVEARLPQVAQAVQERSRR